MPRVVDHDQRREELLAACFALFARRGYAGLTMREIAKELQVSTGTLYHYFDGKPGLFAEMFRWIRARDIRAATESVPSGTGREERLRGLERFVVEHADGLGQALRVALEFQREAADPSSEALLHETLAEYRAAIAEQLGLEDPDGAPVIMSYLLGILIHHTLDPSAVDIGRQVRRVELALSGCSKERC